MEDKKPKVGFTPLIFLVISLLMIGTLGYMWIEGWSFLDSLYMVVITVATVGFREVHALSPAGMIFTMVLIVFGILTISYIIRLFSEYILEVKLEERFSKRMDNSIKQLRNHQVVCGYGRVGREVVSELATEGVPFVVVEKDLQLAAQCTQDGHLCVPGDSTEEETLTAAGILHAKGLVVCLGEDSDTILAIITAKGLNNDLFIVARANMDANAAKLMRIGANRVVSPHQIGGFRMAGFALSPTVADFLDDVQDLGHKEIQINDVVVPNSSPAAGHTISERLSNRDYGVTVLAIHKPDGEAIINPIGDTGVEAGDRLILLGTRDRLDDVLKLLGAK